MAKSSAPLSFTAPSFSPLSVPDLRPSCFLSRFCVPCSVPLPPWIPSHASLTLSLPCLNVCLVALFPNLIPLSFSGSLSIHHPQCSLLLFHACARPPSHLSTSVISRYRHPRIMAFSGRDHVENKPSSMKRELSVDDLFAPLNRLDMRPQSSAVADAYSGCSNISSSSPSFSTGLSTGCLPPRETTSISQGGKVNPAIDFTPALGRHLTVQSQASDQHLNWASCGQGQDLGNLVSASLLNPSRNSFGPIKPPMAPLPPATSGMQAAGVDRGGVTESGNSIASGLDSIKPSMDTSVLEEAKGVPNVVNKSRGPERSRSLIRKGSGGSKSPVSGSDTGLQTQGYSSSDEDQQVLDDRKQRRMLSNRESARRSRLRKQQHLDELRAHVALLRAENSQMLSRFNLTSQHYAQLTEENRLLRSEAVDLTHKLQRLHHTMAAQYSNGLRYGADLGQGGQGILREESSQRKPLS